MTSLLVQPTKTNYKFSKMYYLKHWQSVTVVIMLISCIGNLIYIIN